LIARTLSGGHEWLETGDADFETLLASADDHGVVPLLWQALAGVEGRGRELREALAPIVHAAAARELLVQRDLQATMAALASAGVPALVIKGSALAYSVYPEPWHRTRTDTDLLVSQESVQAAMAALERCGYRRSDAISTGAYVSHQIAFERTDAHDVRHVIDLHWKVANPQIIADALPFDLLWRSAEPAPALGASARVPSLVASVGIACIHRLAHHQGHDRLIWLYDLRLITSRLTSDQWMALAALARDRGVAGLCLDGLQQARRELSASLPVEVEKLLGAAAPAEASQSYLHGPVRKRDVLVSDLKALRSWRARLRLLREHAFPPPAFMRQRYGTTRWWLLPALYVHRFATGAVRWVRT
jgi:hypothetical protein